MAHSWPVESKFKHLTLEVLDRSCRFCDLETNVHDYKGRNVYLLGGPTKLTSQMTLCPEAACPGHHRLLVAEQEALIAPPWWIIGWDAFAQVGYWRFSRNMAVPEIREDLVDSYDIALSEDAIEDYIGRYRAILAARQRDPARLKQDYRSIKGLVLSIDGLQPEKGHETLYTVRELNKKRVWFAAPLLSSSHDEVKKLFVQAKAWVDLLGLPVQGWVTDKQDAFLTGIAEVFPGVHHRYCQNHFLRDVAKPVQEVDSEAKVKMRKKVRGLRAIEKDILEIRQETPSARDDSTESKPEDKNEVVLEYCAAVRGILNKNQGGPLDPPGLRMAEGLKEVRASIQKNIDTRQGGLAEKNFKRLAGCIDRGVDAVAEALEKIPCYVEDLRAMHRMFDPKTGKTKRRKSEFASLRTKLQASGDPIQRKMAEVMKSFEPGLFAGGDKLAWLQDNLDLERWFRTPKAHRRKIHGRQHAGVSIVQEGPSLVLALDAHLQHRRPFTEEELKPYLGAMPTPEELDAIERRKTMRRGASRKARPGLLENLETRYAPQPRSKKRSKSQNHESGG
jgi:hypothetical protein